MSIQLRPPTSSASGELPIKLTPPSLTFLRGTWHVTHSTLPMWKSNRNVHITYTPLSSSGNQSDGDSRFAVRLDDMVTYNSLNSDNVKKIHGIDAPVSEWAYHWRGTGWLAIATSDWELLGYGIEKPDTGAVESTDPTVASPAVQDENQWIVTYFSKTVFTPAGIDIYSRSAKGLRNETVNEIIESLKEMEGPEMKMVGDIFEVKRDHCWLETLSQASRHTYAVIISRHLSHPSCIPTPLPMSISLLYLDGVTSKHKRELSSLPQEASDEL
ncbi:hypothetical protein V1525DRAFT_390288 [Lipomyces kononenkoae]|uniref:Uncharacterized protein n=1 Tax=Lipomyces kononenkoae TaxID=34357 RepID=A0ACC3SVL3_LIPKO